MQGNTGFCRTVLFCVERGTYMKKGKGFLQEFQKFISRGNVMDMAVGVIIGGAFSSIINSLVSDIISPLLGVFGGMNFDNYSLKLIGDATLNYGKFLTAVVNFLIMALVIFCMMRRSMV